MIRRGVMWHARATAWCAALLGVAAVARGVGWLAARVARGR